MTIATTLDDEPPPVVAYEPAPPLDRLAERAAGGETLMDVDQPLLTGTAPMATPLRVAGWAYSKRGIAEVWVVVDGKGWHQALHGQWRSYLMQVLEASDAGPSGFNIVLSPSDCPAGTHTLEVIAIDNDGYAVGIEGTFEAAGSRDGEAEPERGGNDAALPVERLDGNGERFVPELHGGEMIEAEHQARYRWACQLADGRAVLDAGCGVGWGTALLADSGARSVVGLDINEQALASGRQRAGERAEFVRGDLTRLPFDDDSFDLVVSFEAIEHVTKPELALDEMRRVLRPDGLLAISSPNRGVYPAGNPHHLRELTSAELGAALRQLFTHIAVFRQQSHVGSILVEDDGFAIADAGVPLASDVRKVVSGLPGDELYTVAVCGAAELPAMRGVTVLAKEVDLKPWMETIAYLEQRALLAEHDLITANADSGMLRFSFDQALMRHQAADRGRREAEERLAAEQHARETAERQLRETAHWLEDHRRSVSWRITAPLRTAKRRAAVIRDRRG